MGFFPNNTQLVDRRSISSDGLQSVGGHLLGISTAASTSAAWLSASRAIYVPFVIYQGLLVVEMWTFNGGTTGGNNDIGIYDVFGNKIVTKGSTVMSGTSQIQVYDTADTQLNPGQYYMALVNDGTTGRFTRYAPSLPIAKAMGVLSQNSAFPLPTTTATFAAAQDDYLPIFGLTATAAF